MWTNTRGSSRKAKDKFSFAEGLNDKSSSIGPGLIFMELSFTPFYELYFHDLRIELAGHKEPILLET